MATTSQPQAHSSVDLTHLAHVLARLDDDAIEVLALLLGRYDERIKALEERLADRPSAPPVRSSRPRSNPIMLAAIPKAAAS